MSRHRGLRGIPREPRLGVAPPLPLDVYARRPQEELPFPLGRDGASIYSRARHALWHGVQALGLEAGDAVLVPAYHHGSEVEALLRAGLTPLFYEARPTLEPDATELESLLRPDVRALYLIHYMGFPQEVARWRRWCDDRNLLLLEDAGQAWLAANQSGPLGSLGDLAIFCLYKMVGVPDGGALIARARGPRPHRHRPLGLGAIVKRHAIWTLQRSGSLAVVGDAIRRPREYSRDDDFALNDPWSAPMTATLALLPRLVDSQVAARRRANYAALLRELRGLVPPPFDVLPEGACPFALPVETDDKRGIIAALAQRGIEAGDFWSVPHPALPVDQFPNARERRARTIILPVHQELRAQDVERIAVEVLRPLRRQPSVRLRSIGSFEELGTEWDALAVRSRNVFATREWLALWWQHFGRGRRLLLTACESSEGAVTAILPLYLDTQGPFRVLRLLGHGTADELGPICAPDDRARAARALRQLLDRPPVPWNVFLGELLPGDEAWSRILGGRTLARDGSPVLRFEQPTWDAYLAARGRNFRKHLWQAHRRLAAEHDVRYRLADDPERLSADLDTLFELHRMQRTDAESPFAAAEGFHREFAGIAHGLGWLQLWILEVDGQPVAAEYGFRFAGSLNFYQGGRDPRWQDASVGSLLFAHAVRQALDDGILECRFLRGREAYKYRFANHDAGLQTVAVGRGMLADAALATATALARVPQVRALRRALAP